MCECAGKCVTEREAVERERKAAEWAFGEAEEALRRAGQKRGADWLLDSDNLDWEDTAAARYPLPKVRRLREVGLGMWRYRWNPDPGTWQFSAPHGRVKGIAWETASELPAYIFDALADLKRDPYEEVDG